MLVWTTAFVVASWLQAPAAGTPALAAVSSELQAVMETATKDWNRGDLDGFVAPYDERATFMTRRGPIGTAEMRASYEKNYFGGGKPHQQLRYERLHVVPLAADSAMMTGRFVLSGGDRPEQSGWFTLVWIRTPRGWKIVHDHTS